MRYRPGKINIVLNALLRLLIIEKIKKRLINRDTPYYNKDIKVKTYD